MYRILIRPLTNEDAKVSYIWRNDPEIWKYTGKRPDRTITYEIEDNWIRKVLAASDSFRFAIEADGHYIGNIQITNIRTRQDGEYHIFIGDRKFWGKGIATLATYQLIRFAKEVIGLKRLYLFVNPLNTAAIRVYEKCGFVRNSDEIKMVFNLDQALHPTVSVLMITYNHGSFIKRAIYSALIQRTNFDFDITIGEDCSTDNTRLVIKQITEKYPGKFKLILHDQNIGAMANQIATSEVCTGKYIAICEGDDYWIDPFRLQKQVDFLEENPEYGLVYGKQYHLGFDGKFNSYVPPPISTFEDLLFNSSIPTASTCLRKSLLNRFISDTSSVSKNWLLGDFPLWLSVYQNSKIKYLDEFYSVYRKHEDSNTDLKSFTKGELFYKSVIDIKTYFYSFYRGKKPLRDFIRKEYKSLFDISLEHHKILKCVKYFPYNPMQNIRFIGNIIRKKF